MLKRPLFGFTRGPGGIQTPNLLIRSQMLYSVKLRNHSLFREGKNSGIISQHKKNAFSF